MERIDITITRRVGQVFEGESGPDLHVWEGWIDSERVCELAVGRDDHEIKWVGVNDDRQGLGYATDLYRHASAEMTIYHAPAWHRTDDGNAFADRVGGPSITTCTCCTHLHNDTEEFSHAA